MASTDERFRNLADYPSLKKLAAALWKKDDSYHGAAIMVGAGFSRSGAQTGDVTKDKLPLWNDFSKLLGEELGVDNNINPLRLAEEYHAYFGKEALHDLIKKRINDAAWTPGDLHKRLLQLPWTEVLTTNWDTLLERASNDPNQPIYSLVSKQEDLASARSPRIVKLHGTVNITDDLIFTEEDYRKYPQCYAAFVNFTRQVFIENELCLLGFSGDDPNFIQWAGWVRDHLSGHARRIYLVGALQLNATKRKYLESLNIAPIDLSDLVSDCDDPDIKHQKTAKKFIDFLEENKPTLVWEWKTENFTHLPWYGDVSLIIPKAGSTALERKLPILIKERENYPHWIICPFIKRHDLSNQLKNLRLSANIIFEMEDTVREKLLYEIAWRYNLIYKAIPPWLIKILISICDPDKTCSLKKKQQLEIALILLKKMKFFSKVETNNFAEDFEAEILSILEKNEKSYKDISNELSYYKCILYRDSLCFSELEEHLKKISINDPTWKIKKASILTEIGEFEAGKNLLEQAYKEFLENYRKDQNSIYLLSCLYWSKWIFLKTGMFDDYIKEKPYQKDMLLIKNNNYCTYSPEEEIKHIENDIQNHLQWQTKKQQKQSFSVGYYTTNNISFSNYLEIPLDLEEMSTSLGIPINWNNYSILDKIMVNITKFKNINSFYRLLLTIRTSAFDGDDNLDRVFSRIQIAILKKEEIDSLFHKCINAVNFFSEKLSANSKNNTYFLQKIRVFLEVLARISIRLNTSQAQEVFLFGCKFANKKEHQHIWLYSSLKNLINYSLESIPSDLQPNLLEEALFFPFFCEERESAPNPIIKFPGDRKKNSLIDRRIDEIIDNIAPLSIKSQLSLMRLLPLVKANFLRKAETKKILEKIWDTNPDYKKILETGMSSKLLEFLPSDSALMKKKIREYFFEDGYHHPFNISLLQDIINSARIKNNKILPSEEQAHKFFEKLILWRKQDESNGFSEKISHDDQVMSMLIGEALSYSIVPSLSSKHITKKNLEKIINFYEEVGSTSVIIAMVYFNKLPKFSENLEKIIIENLEKKEKNIVFYACYATLKWKEIKGSYIISNIINHIIYSIGVNNMIILPPLVGAANEFIQKNYLSKAQLNWLLKIIPIIFDSTKYNNLFSLDREYLDISITRSFCIKIAKNLLIPYPKDKELLRLLREAKTDPLPEVRFA